MRDIITEFPPHLQKQVDLGTPGTDILHGHLKSLMYECDLELANLSETQDVPDYQYYSGRMDALTEIYVLTYNLTFAIDDRRKNEARG